MKSCFKQTSKQANGSFTARRTTRLLTVLPALLPTEATEEVSLDSPEREVLLSDGPSPAITPITPPTSIIPPRITIGHDDMFTHSSFDEVSGLRTTPTLKHGNRRSQIRIERDFPSIR